MKHLKEQNETYLQHFRCAIKFSGILFKLSLCCFVHAFLPCLFCKTASERLEKLVAQMKRKEPV